MDCEILIIVPRIQDVPRVICGVGDPSLGPEIKFSSNGLDVTKFRSFSGCPIAVAVCAREADLRTRMHCAADLARTTLCSRLILVNPGYTENEHKVRHVVIPEDCMCLFATDIAFLLDALALDDRYLGPLHRAVLAELFGLDLSPPVRTGRPPPPVVDAQGDDWEPYIGQVNNIVDDDDGVEDIDMSGPVTTFSRASNTLSTSVITHPRGVVSTTPTRTGASFASQIAKDFHRRKNDAARAPPPVRFVRETPVAATATAAAVTPVANPPPQISAGVRTVGSTRSIGRARIEARLEADRIIDLASGTTDASKMLKRPREEDSDIAAMATTAEDNTCSICMTSHITSAPLPCKHLHFCFVCINTWVEAHHKCPSCNFATTAVIQVVPKFNAQEEHRRRRRDPAHLEDVAKALEAEVTALRKTAEEVRIQKLSPQSTEVAAAAASPTKVVPPPPPPPAKKTKTKKKK